jgi:hypothetical protein
MMTGQDDNGTSDGFARNITACRTIRHGNKAAVITQRYHHSRFGFIRVKTPDFTGCC